MKRAAAFLLGDSSNSTAFAIVVALDLAEFATTEAGVLVGFSTIHIVVFVAQPQRMTNDESTDASTGAHALLVRVAEVDPFPDTCVDHFVDALTELRPEMIEGRVGRVCATMVTPGLSLKSAVRIWAMAPLISLCAEGYSGNAGVARNGPQPGSGEMRTPSALRIALIGRHTL
ncbi:MAG TPA: hypothetical protein VKE96_30710 [Vicinamibacterales bacterium]|nr:hypothetical protein [Vicinamibacterales bacterium]